MKNENPIRDHVVSKQDLWDVLDDVNRLTMIGRTAAGIAVRVRDTLVSIQKQVQAQKQRAAAHPDWLTHLQRLEERVEQMQVYNNEMLALAAYEADDRQWMDKKDKEQFENRFMKSGRLVPSIYQLLTNRLLRFRRELQMTEQFDRHDAESKTWRKRIEVNITDLEKGIGVLLHLSSK